MRQVEKIIANNKEIVYLDFSGMRSKEEIFLQLDYFGKYIKLNSFGSLTTLTNLDGMYFNTEIYNAFTAYVKGNNTYVKESAVIGLKGMMQIFYKGFIALTGRNIKVCNDISEAVMALANTTNFSFVNEKAAPKVGQP